MRGRIILFSAVLLAASVRAAAADEQPICPDRPSKSTGPCTVPQGKWQIETGLIDFPALVTGRQVWLCWRLGEGDVDWWHELDEGFGGRRPLSELT